MKRLLSFLATVAALLSTVASYAAGEVIVVPAPYEVDRGDPVVIGLVTGIAANDAAQSAQVRVWREGKFTVAKTTGEAWAIGDALYFASGDTALSKDPSKGFFGFASAVATSGAATGSVTLVPQVSLSHREAIRHFGDGSDGDLTISSATQTSGTLIVSGVLKRDAYFRDLTMAATGAVKMNGFRIYVSRTLDLTEADAACFYVLTPSAGGAGAATTTGGVAVSTTVSPATTALPANGTTGGTGGAAAGGNGNGPSSSLWAGGTGGTGGDGGAGSGGAGGTGNAPTMHARVIVTYPDPEWSARSSNNTVRGSHPGGSGAGGGGDGTAGAGGGAGGIGGEAIWIAARRILTGASTATGLFFAPGGDGGAGGTPAAGDRGGGGGGGGGSGGPAWVTYLDRDGAARTNAFDLPGGAGGAKGLASGTGTDGTDGAGGSGGTVILCSVLTGLCTTTHGTVAPSGMTGGSTAVTL